MTFRELDAARAGEYVARGGRQRDFFAHRVHYLPKGGPDGLKTATRMLGRCALEQLWEVVLYAAPEVAGEFPRELFFDRDLIWHQQHFGRPGSIATANLVIGPDRVHSMVHVSDLVQRISRRREHRSRVENRFHGWDRLLLNAVLSFADERGLATVFMPSADLALRHTDRARDPQRELFARVYDRHVTDRFVARRDGEWWALDVRANRGRIVPLARRAEPARDEKIVCVCHDIERGLGHADVDAVFARRADATAGADLAAMLAHERAAGVRATYSVVGAFLPEVREAIDAGGHAVAFHSFDHRVEGRGLLARVLDRLRRARGGYASEQLDGCRRVDYRIRGYRPAQSRVSADLSDERLSFHNFEWLASSAYSLGLRQPSMQHRVVKIPILFDDWPMYSQGVAYAAWEDKALRALEQAPVAAFSLHDCYAEHWLPNYPRFLDAVRRLGTLKTLDEIADDVILRHAG